MVSSDIHVVKNILFTPHSGRYNSLHNSLNKCLPRHVGPVSDPDISYRGDSQFLEIDVSSWKLLSRLGKQFHVNLHSQH